MPKRVSKKNVLMACKMAFEGLGNREIGRILGYNEATISAWRKHEVWQEFEAELIKAYKEHALDFKDATPS